LIFYKGQKISSSWRFLRFDWFFQMEFKLYNFFFCKITVSKTQKKKSSEFFTRGVFQSFSIFLENTRHNPISWWNNLTFPLKTPNVSYFRTKVSTKNARMSLTIYILCRFNLSSIYTIISVIYIEEISCINTNKDQIYIKYILHKSFCKIYFNNLKNCKEEILIPPLRKHIKVDSNIYSDQFTVFVNNRSKESKLQRLICWINSY